MTNLCPAEFRVRALRMLTEARPDRVVKRGKRVLTTKSDPAGRRPTDLVQRHFRADAPRRLWVVDVTYVRTWQDSAHVAFITEVFSFSRRIVGWNVASTVKADILPLQTLDMAAFGAGGDLTGSTHHSDHGSNSTALVYTDRIAELGAIPSTETVEDSYDNAMAEAVNALYKAELIRARGPGCTVPQDELPSLEWVWWWNNQRLHSELDYRRPVEAENEYYADPESLSNAIAFQGKTWERNPGRFSEHVARQLVRCPLAVTIEILRLTAQVSRNTIFHAAPHQQVGLRPQILTKDSSIIDRM